VNNLLTDEFHEWVYVCRICGEPTGEKASLRSKLADPYKMIEGFDPTNPDHLKQREGFCPKCVSQLSEGCTAFFAEPDDGDDTRPARGVMLESSTTHKIRDEYKGKALKVPMDRLDEWFPPKPAAPQLASELVEEDGDLR